MNIGENLHELRIKLGISQPAIAKKFDITLSSWKKYEVGASEPGAGALQGLAEGGVNINWLLTGKGEMLLVDQVNKAEAVTHNQINTVEFLRIFERLLEKDFTGCGMDKSYIAYFAALIYSRVMSESEERRSEVFETSVKELGLILLDGFATNLELTISFAQRETPDSPHIEPMLQAAEEYATLLGSLRGKFAGRMLSPGSQLEGEFLKGLALATDSPD